MTSRVNLLPGPDPVLLPDEPAVLTMIARGIPSHEVVRRFPASPLAWAAASDDAWQAGLIIESYAFARVGYHRGLDLLRRHGWKGHGPVPWDHEPNRGFLRCLRSLGRAADAIDERAEADRIVAFLADCDSGIPSE